jgi:hypothetical protein
MERSAAASTVAARRTLAKGGVEKGSVRAGSASTRDAGPAGEAASWPAHLQAVRMQSRSDGAERWQHTPLRQHGPSPESTALARGARIGAQRQATSR